MGLMGYLRRRRERKCFAEKVLADIKLIEGQALSRPFSSTNNYFSCAFMLLRVEQAVKNRDHDALLVYDRFMESSYPYESVLNALRVLRAMRGASVADIITEEHVRVATRLLEAYVEHPRYDPFKGTKDYDAMLELVYGNMDEAERIILTVTERGITDAALIREVLEAGAGAVAPLMKGEL